MQTPQNIIDMHISEMYQFKTAQDFQNYLRSLPHSGFIPDYVAISGILYTMDNYDFNGKVMTYGNQKTGLSFEVSTADRYKQGVFDATVSEPENLGISRNDIVYAE